MDSENSTVMLSCVGRQVSLVKQFKRAVGASGRVLTSDVDPCAAGLAAASRCFIAPAFDSAEYGDWMVDVCRRERVSLLLSLVPEDLLRLEACRGVLKDAGTRLIGMEPPLLQMCLDKFRLAELCEGTDLRTPSTWRCADLESIPDGAFPLVAKVRTGSGSRGMTVLASRAIAEGFRATQEASGAVETYVLQPQLVGQEFGLDVVNDLNGDHVTTFVRRKLRMRGGETDVALTVCDEHLSAIGRTIGVTLGHQGPADVDIMRCSDGDYLLDINPRFGGGYTFSHAAGADLPAALVAWHLGCTPDPAWVDPVPGVRSARISGLQQLGTEL